MTAEAHGLRFASSRALSKRELEAVKLLESTCLASDGGRLKLEYRSLLNRTGERESDFTAWVRADVPADETLVGFLGLYQWRPDEIELTGMVHPGFRRRGIFSKLYEAALAEVRERRAPKLLLVMDRDWDPAHGFAAARGARYETSEHRMVQRREPADGRRRLSILVRQAAVEDADFVVDCLSQSFGLPRIAFGLESAKTVVASMLVVECDGRLVGTLRLELHEDDGLSSAGIYGFGVMPSEQGRGIGRQVLTELTAQLRADGVEQITLEVGASNDSALRLYEGCGFDRVGTEDYYLVEPLAASKAWRGGHPSAAGRSAS